MDPRAALVIPAVLGLLVGGGAGAAASGGGSTRTVTDTVVSTEVERATDTVTVKKRVTKVKTVTTTVPAPDLVPSPDNSGGSASDDDLDADGCSDSYEGACLPPSDGFNDVNCGEISDTDFDSVGDDPYGLDRDGDGIACES